MKMTIVYDGTYEGFLTAVFDGVYSREKEVALIREQDFEGSLLETRRADTDLTKSRRVYDAMCAKLTMNTANAVYHAWLSCLPEMDSTLFRFIKFAFDMGRDVTPMIYHPLVSRVVRTAEAVGRQAHKFMGLLRFRKVGGLYIADMEPDYDVLPLITWHFTDRFGSQSFAIRDLRHRRVLLHEGVRERRTLMLDIEGPAPVLASSDDFEQLWKGYYESMTIKERISPDYDLRQKFIPKKFRGHICELSAN